LKLLDELYIQLYSVRDILWDDYETVFESLGSKGMGYSGVEFAGYGGLSVQTMQKLLEVNGLKPLGCHLFIDTLVENIDNEIKYAKELGIEYITCSMAPMETKDDAITAAKKLTPACKKITETGMKFAYHNHAHEFVIDDGKYLLDILFENLPDEALMQLDIYWSELAKVDSFAYMEKHKNRLKLMHIKQIGKNGENAEVEKGLIDFAQVIKLAKTLGVKHFILEQEEYETTSTNSAQAAIKYLKSL